MKYSYDTYLSILFALLQKDKFHEDINQVHLLHIPPTDEILLLMQHLIHLPFPGQEKSPIQISCPWVTTEWPESCYFYPGTLEHR